MQSHAMSIRSVSTPFGFGCQFEHLDRPRKRRLGIGLEDVSVEASDAGAMSQVSELKTATSCNVDLQSDPERQVIAALHADAVIDCIKNTEASSA